MIFIKKHQGGAVSTSIVTSIEETVVDAEVVERLNEVVQIVGSTIQPGEFNIATTWIKEFSEDSCVAILVLNGGEMFAFYEKGNGKFVVYLNITLGYKKIFEGTGQFSFIQQTPASKSVEWTGDEQTSYLRVGEHR